jgi:hypothetical protein
MQYRKRLMYRWNLRWTPHSRADSLKSIWAWCSLRWRSSSHRCFRKSLDSAPCSLKVLLKWSEMIQCNHQAKRNKLSKNNQQRSNQIPIKLSPSKSSCPPEKNSRRLILWRIKFKSAPFLMRVLLWSNNLAHPLSSLIKPPQNSSKKTNLLLLETSLKKWSNLIQ